MCSISFPQTVRSRFGLILALALFLPALAGPAWASPEGSDSSSETDSGQGLLQRTVEAYVEAVENRDLEGVLATITTSDSLPLIFPDGTILRTRQQYVDFHREWFADEGWTMEMEQVSLLEQGGLGIALMRTTYTDSAGPRQAYLVLTFGRENGEWRLVFDQNTRIVEPQE